MLRNTKFSLEHTGTSVEFRFVAVTKNKPEALCLHYKTVYNPEVCREGGTPCQLIDGNNNQCYSMDGPGDTRDKECSAFGNDCLACT